MHYVFAALQELQQQQTQFSVKISLRCRPKITVNANEFLQHVYKLQCFQVQTMRVAGHKILSCVQKLGWSVEHWSQTYWLVKWVAVMNSRKLKDSKEPLLLGNTQHLWGAIAATDKILKDLGICPTQLMRIKSMGDAEVEVQYSVLLLSEAGAVNFVRMCLPYHEPQIPNLCLQGK